MAQAAEKTDSPLTPVIDLLWLDGTAPHDSPGVTWGVPWPQGRVAKGQSFSLATVAGTQVPMQTWPLAYWPDGSLKWTAHAVGPQANPVGAFRLAPGARAEIKGALSLRQTVDEVIVDTGSVVVKLARKGSELIRSVERDGRVIAQWGTLVALRQDDGEFPPSKPVQIEEFSGQIRSVTVEQDGPVRAVVKVEGAHQNPTGRDWLPFSIRLYFYVGSDEIRVVHSFIYDGDPEKDFVRGLGVRFSVPMRDELYNRHVRFSGEGDGLWGEGIRNLSGLRRNPGTEVTAAQFNGQHIKEIPEGPVRELLQYIPAWGDFSLAQLSSDGFTIRKRTKAGHAWIPAGAGRRASGSGYVGGTSGGVAFGLRDFWQKFPAQLDIRDAESELAQVSLWLWAPDAGPMDLRPYHDGLGMDTFYKQRQGLDITYEDYEPEFNTPYGVARTAEITLKVVAATPSRADLAAFSKRVQEPPLLVAAPEKFLEAKVFGGLWSPVDHSTPAKAAIEKQLDHLLALFPQQREEHRWYGFWDFGDWMHSYDGVRHAWRYDVGGFAWANSELSPDLWLWYSFLRTGRRDVFRLAEAMTRHTSEVDVHHIGRFAGLGSRHNVQHWGDSSKQVRISSAAYKRFYYYLTADERTGDLMRALVDTDKTVAAIDVGRKLNSVPEGALQEAENGEKPSMLAFGTSWLSVVAAWLTEWERTGNTMYRDKIVAGMRSIGTLPRGWFAGSAEYNVETGALKNDSLEISVSHLNSVFGAVEINAELFQLLDVPEYRAAWLAYCRLYNAPAEHQEKELGRPLRRLNLREAHSRLTAFAAHETKSRDLAKRAWAEFYEGRAGLGVKQDFQLRRFEGPEVLNPVTESVGMSTNAASQWGLAAIQNLALVGEYLEG